jgi:hypothetical protein
MVMQLCGEKGQYTYIHTHNNNDNNNNNNKRKNLSPSKALPFGLRYAECRLFGQQTGVLLKHHGVFPFQSQDTICLFLLSF